MSFDLLAPYYRWMEILLAGGKMQAGRTAFLNQIPPPGNILLLGEGHGRSLVEFCRKFPKAQITCVDASERMLAQARRHLQRHGLTAGRVEFIQADVLNWHPSPATYDLVATHFFLDCFRPEQLEQIIPKIALSLPAHGIWLLADFQVPATGWRGIRSWLILRLLYFFFRTLARLPAQQLTRPDSFMEQAGMTLHRRTIIDWGLLHSDWWLKQL